MHRRARHLNPGSAGAVLALDSRFITGLSDGDPVSTWTDRSGSGNDATQSNSLYKASFQTNEQGGQPIVLFDGANDYFDNSYTGPGLNFTFLVISKSATALLSQSQIRFQSGATYCIFPWTNNGSVSPIAIDSNNGGISGISTGFETAFTVNAYVSASLATNGKQVFTNSAITSQGNTGSGSSNVALYIGGVGFAPGVESFSGQIAAITICNFAASNSLRRRLEHAAAFAFKIPCS